MSKADKILERLCRVPVPSDIRWSEIETLMHSFGYITQNGKGSKRKFINVDKKHIVDCHEPHPQPVCKQYLVEKIKAHLTTVGIIDADI
ncbi:MAG TPA: type II toxin-antitoxin system HicA family toxin [Methylophilus sp.]|uniref:type II toxin-antitoxin system HicA family toxin n=1 Tax=Methylophilus sp. TaxID=29541 RepID=UPI002D065F44|nr:type II toxin-antitoxin system HicA family toxin [Methylophilus sp.]HSH86866.1 type II toxin-antitoxin system HicA family toxin [Methylophilus sp.]